MLLSYEYQTWVSLTNYSQGLGKLQGVCKLFFKYMTLVYSFKGAVTPPSPP